MDSLGICIDGNELKFAHIRRRRSGMEVMALEKVAINELIGAPQAEPGHDDLVDAFGTGTAEEDVITGGAPEQFDSSMLFNTLLKHTQKDMRIGLNIQQSDVSFTNIVVERNGKKQNIRSVVKEELTKLSDAVGNDNFGYLCKNGVKYIAFYHNNRFDLLHEIQKVNTAVNSGLRIELVDINEVALINLFNNMVKTGENETSALVYVGNEFSRIIFFKGGKLTEFSQLINEGYRSDSLLGNLFGKIVFEIEMAGITELHNIFITGDGSYKEYAGYFTERFEGCKVAPLPFERFFNFHNEADLSVIDSFAIPLALAWKVLDKNNKKLIDTNFLPSMIKKQQRAFGLTWPNALLCLLLSCVLGYTGVRHVWNLLEISGLTNSITQVEQQIDEIIPVVEAVGQVAGEIRKLDARLALVDSLRPGTVLFSDMLRHMAADTKALNSVWLTEFSGTTSTFLLSGNSLFRSRVYQLARTLNESLINNVDFTQVQSKDIYNFNISGFVAGTVQ